MRVRKSIPNCPETNQKSNQNVGPNLNRFFYRLSNFGSLLGGLSNVLEQSVPKLESFKTPPRGENSNGDTSVRFMGGVSF